MIRRVFLVVMDGCGVGELPDADLYGDVGSNTFGNICKEAAPLDLPNLEKMGIGHLGEFESVGKVESIAAFGKCTEVSQGKDSSVGHWEIAGLATTVGSPVYPDGFPEDLVKKYETLIGRKVLCNKPGSGTDFIDQYGKEHRQTGNPIIYTSSDSVFQLAAHEDVISLEDQYEMCRIAREEVMVGSDNVLRVIARPFKGKSGSFYRTEGRKDYSVKPGGTTLLDILMEAGVATCGIGKIDELFVYQGLSNSFHTRNNESTLNKMFEIQQEKFAGLVFVNLIDFDMLYGHRNDIAGFAKALQYFDGKLGEFFAQMNSDDLLIVTADHGNDPTTISTDHSREYIPLLVYGHQVKQGYDLGIRESFADIGKSVADMLQVDDAGRLSGVSFWNDIRVS